MKLSSIAVMGIVLLGAGNGAFAQQQSTDAPKPDLAVISARLGPCSTEFTVTDTGGKPIYAAMVHVRVRYGAFSLKRMDLEVGTSSDGKARVDSLPSKAKLLAYDVSKGDKHASVTQDVATTCHAKYDVTLK